MLARFKRVELVCAPTPLGRLTSISQLLGKLVLIKRDDLTGLAGGGNKARKLEYLLGDSSCGADCVVTVGAVQSNHCRMTAAAGSMLGLPVRLVLEGDPDSPMVGNLLLDRLLGAEIVFCEPGQGEATLDAEAARLQKAGRKPYRIPMGGSSPIGALGYVRAMWELSSQLYAAGVDDITIYCATSSGGTHAGLVVGAQLFMPRARIVGISVSRQRDEASQRVLDLARQMAALLDINAPDPSRVVVIDDYMGPGYGVPTAEATAALRLLARREGILLDPVYTAKAMAGLLDRERGSGPAALFWHTGGVPSLSAHPQLADDINEGDHE